MEIERLAPLLDHDVTAIIEGRKTLDQCLTTYRHEGAEMGALLKIALTLVNVPSTPDPSRKARARQNLIAVLVDQDVIEPSRERRVESDPSPSNSGKFDKNRKDLPPNVLFLRPWHSMSETLSVG